MQKRRILILGAGGQLGCELTHQCQSHSQWQVHALSHREIEITDAQAVRKMIQALCPWAILNCTAHNQVDVAEADPIPAFAINSGAVALLANICHETNSLLVHFSTDYIFDGKTNRPYQEDDPPAPLNIYGLSKLAGEQAIRLLHPRHCIIRTCGLYGRYRSPRTKLNFVETLLTKIQNNHPLHVRRDLVCTPTAASELAEVVCQLLEQEAVGTFHATNSGHCSWHEFASEILKCQGLRREIIPMPTPAKNKVAQRPAYSVLNTSKLTATGVRPMSPWQEALAAYLHQRAL